MDIYLAIMGYSLIALGVVILGAIAYRKIADAIEYRKEVKKRVDELNKS